MDSFLNFLQAVYFFVLWVGGVVLAWVWVPGIYFLLGRAMVKKLKPVEYNILTFFLGIISFLLNYMMIGFLFDGEVKFPELYWSFESVLMGLGALIIPTAVINSIVGSIHGKSAVRYLFVFFIVYALIIIFFLLINPVREFSIF